jgi:nucleotide-binding universal stress UspA family protein
MIKRILVPMMGSELADETFECAFNLAGLNKAMIDLLFAIDISRSTPRIPMAGLLATSGRLVENLSKGREEREREEKEKAQLVIQGYETRCRRARIKVSSTVAPGYPGEEILRRQRVADLVCMENPGVRVKRKYLRRANLMLARITRHAARPIIFISSVFRPFEKVLVAYDGSLEATKAIKVVTEIGGTKPKFHVTLLTLSDDEESGQRILAEGEEYLSPYGLRVTPRIETGRQGKNILRIAREIDAQLIVMGAFGANRIKDLIFGSTTEYLLSESEIPLLVCH